MKIRNCFPAILIIACLISSCSHSLRIRIAEERLAANKVTTAFLIESPEREDHIPDTMINGHDSDLQQLRIIVRTIANDPARMMNQEYSSDTIPAATAHHTVPHCNSRATWSFVLGSIAAFSALGLFLGGVGVMIIGMLLGIPALITGIMGMKQIRREPGKFTNRWQAITGIVLGTAVLILLVLLTFAFVAFFYI